MAKPRVNKLAEQDLVSCIECGGKLVRTTKTDLKALKIFLKSVCDFPRGLWRCEDCGEIVTITVTTSDLKMEVWHEELQKLSGSEISGEQEAVAAIIDSVMITPSKTERDVVSITEVLKCEGTGVGCRHYWLAASGLGTEAICGSKHCLYDSYSPSWYQKHFRGKLLERSPLAPPDMTCYWESVFEEAGEAQNFAAQEDALRRLGSFARISRVRDLLIGIMLDQKLDFQLRAIAINALSNIRNPKEMTALRNPFMQLLSGGELTKIKRTIMIAVRKMRFIDIDLMEKIALLSGTKILEHDAKVALRALERAMGVQVKK